MSSKSEQDNFIKENTYRGKRIYNRHLTSEKKLFRNYKNIYIVIRACSSIQKIKILVKGTILEKNTMFSL